MKITVFDFDGTLTNKDSLQLFLVFAFGPFRYWLGIGALLPWLIGYKAGLMGSGPAKERLFRHFFKGMQVEEFNRLCLKFQEVLEKHIRTDILTRLHEARQAGHTVCIISASPENWILPWAGKQGVDCVLSTLLSTDHRGRLTGSFATPNCNGEEKVIRLLSAFPGLKNNRENYTLYAYGNSCGDKALIDFANQGWYV